MTKPLVIYHGPSCADGFTAAWVAHRYFESRGGCELHPANYGDAPPDVDGRDVVIVDFSYPRAVLVEMRERARSLLVLDHHKSAEEDLRGLPFVVFDMDRSGAGLTWDHFFPLEDRPWLVSYVEDRDLWRWALPESRAVSAHLRTVPFELEAWTAVSLEDEATAAARGRAILAFVDAQVRGHVERATPAQLGGFVVPVVNATAVMSEVGNELARSAPFAATYSIAPDGTFQYSLRSRAENPEHVDVSEVAKRYGGGGHRHAAGFRSPDPVHTPGDRGAA